LKKTKAKTKNKTKELKRVAPKFIQIMMAGDLDCLPTKLEKKLLCLLYDIRMVVPLEAEFCGYWDKKSVSTWDTKKNHILRSRDTKLITTLISHCLITSILGTLGWQGMLPKTK
jgi:hypothetical protein